MTQHRLLVACHSRSPTTCDITALSCSTSQLENLPRAHDITPTVCYSQKPSCGMLQTSWDKAKSSCSKRKLPAANENFLQMLSYIIL